MGEGRPFAAAQALNVFRMRLPGRRTSVEAVEAVAFTVTMRLTHNEASGAIAERNVGNGHVLSAGERDRAESYLV